jgi:hypothetical protein
MTLFLLPFESINNLLKQSDDNRILQITVGICLRDRKSSLIIESLMYEPTGRLGARNALDSKDVQ